MGLCPLCYNNELNVLPTSIYENEDDDDKSIFSLYLNCRQCGWKGKFEDTLTQEEAKNKRRTKIIDKMLDGQKNRN